MERRGRGRGRGFRGRGRGGGGGGRGRGHADERPHVEKKKPSAPPLALPESFCMQVQAELQALMDDPMRSEMSFPSSLDNHQRRYIHSVVEKLGLFSKSNGKGENRFIHVAKVKKNAKMEKISLHLPVVTMNKESMEWMPPSLQSYWTKYPMVSNDPLAVSTARKPHQPLQHPHHTTQHAMFPPLVRSANSTTRRPMVPRSDLPVHAYRQEILEHVARHQVVIVSGDTGCGKSTQIPQFLLDQAIAEGKESETRIICSQPRRISAISLAERVAMERKSRVGQEIGHAVRFDAQFDPIKSKLVFCTTGTLLKWLNGSDPLAFSHLVIDEVHERDQFTDFLLILLKLSVLKQRPQLKIVLMSATIQVEKFAEYFRPTFDAPIIEMTGGRCFPVETLFLEDSLALVNTTSSNQTTKMITRKKKSALLDLACGICGYVGFEHEDAFGLHVATCFGTPPPLDEEQEEEAEADDLHDQLQQHLAQWSKDQKHALLQTYVQQEDALRRDQAVDYDLILQLLGWIDQWDKSSSRDGAVLVFLPGWEEISVLERRIFQSDVGHRHEIALLHSRLSSDEQRKAFQRPRPGRRKVILATNIAETSLTIADVVYVIDSGKSKQAHVLASTSSASFVTGLQTTWIAKANCIQRTGRAGRVKPGVCFRLFSQARFETAMKEFMVPELLTTPLEELVLHIKLLQVEQKLPVDCGVKAFLAAAMDPPSDHMVDCALERLHQMHALTSAVSTSQLTRRGWFLAHISGHGVSVPLAQLILSSHFVGNFDTIVKTVAAVSSYRDPFVNFVGATPEELRQVQQSKQLFMASASKHLQCDPLALGAALEQFAAVEPRSFRQLEAFCRPRMLFRPALEQGLSIYKHLLHELAFVKMTTVSQFFRDAPTDAQHVMALVAGLYPRLLYSTDSQQTWQSKEKVKVKMESGSLIKPIHGRLEWLVYQDMMQSERMRMAKYGTKIISPLPLLLLIGDAVVQEPFVEEESGISYVRMVLDDWLVFQFDSQDDADRVLTLRQRLHAAFDRHLERVYHPCHSHHQHAAQEAHDRELLQAITSWIQVNLWRPAVLYTLDDE